MSHQIRTLDIANPTPVFCARGASAFGGETSLNLYPPFFWRNSDTSPYKAKCKNKKSKIIFPHQLYPPLANPFRTATQTFILKKLYDNLPKNGVKINFLILDLWVDKAVRL